MKKLAILFLLTTVLAAFTFGQVSVKGEFGLNNLSGQKKAAGSHTGAEGDVNPYLTLQFDAAASTENIGPGTLGGEIHMGVRSNFAEEAGAGHVMDGDNFFKIKYTLAMGPGSLTPYLRASLTKAPNSYGISGGEARPGVDFTGIDVGAATLGFGLWYQYGYTGYANRKDTAGGRAFGSYDRSNNLLAFVFYADLLDAKLHIEYDFVYGVGGASASHKQKKNGTADNGSGINKIAYLNINYDVTDALNVGLEVDDTHDSFWGFTLKPQASYKVNDNVSLGAFFTVYNIMGDTQPSDKTKDKGDIGFTPGIWAKYTF